MVYPNTYEVGMSSLGFQVVYALLNEREDIVCERFFLPEGDEDYLSVESGRLLTDFSFVFLSISFEYDYLNVVKSLLLAGLEPFAEKRSGQSQKQPLVVFGGVACFLNPEPIAPLADVIIVGEAEPLLSDFVTFLQTYEGKVERQIYLAEAMLQFQGVYVPSLYTPEYDNSGRCCGMTSVSWLPRRVERVSLKHCDQAGHSELLTPAAEFADLYLTELGRGCSRGCRFCAAGFIYRPPRLWDGDAVVEGLQNRADDVSRIGLVGMEMASDSTLEQVSTYLLESGCALSFSSLRADRINPQLYELLAQSDLKSVAIAPDGASERLRKVINKGLDEKDLLLGATRLVEAGIFKLKVYVMVGLPTETNEDLQEFIDLIGRMKHKIDEIGKRRGRLTEMYLSVNCFVPKPWTPFQYHPFGVSEVLEKNQTISVKDALERIKKKIVYLKTGLRGLNNVHFQADKPENALFQAVLSRGDRRLAKVLVDMVAAGLTWKRGLKKNNLSAEQFAICGYDKDSYFPWYIIDQGISTRYLWQEYTKGLQSAITEPCDTKVCRRCGVCDDS